MTLYTKTGDEGITSLYRGKRLLKSDPLIEAYGSIDELTSFIGFVINKNSQNKKLLTEIQKDLYRLMSNLSGSKTNLSFINKQVLLFEKTIDKLSKKLPPLKNFILLQGTELSCWFHILRVICRRAERSIVSFYNQSPVSNHQPLIIKYLNRLSDLFFTLARHYNNQEKVIIIK